MRRKLVETVSPVDLDGVRGVQVDFSVRVHRYQHVSDVCLQEIVGEFLGFPSSDRDKK